MSNQKIHSELEMCEKLLAVWVILKCEEVCGRIIARYSRSGGTTFVTFILYSKASFGGNGEPIFGYERMTGYGYNRTGAGIGEILDKNREKLKADYGIELSIQQAWEIQNTWRKDIEAAGYNVNPSIINKGRKRAGIFVNGEHPPLQSRKGKIGHENGNDNER